MQKPEEFGTREDYYKEMIWRIAAAENASYDHISSIEMWKGHPGRLMLLWLSMFSRDKMLLSKPLYAGVVLGSIFLVS